MSSNLQTTYITKAPMEVASLHLEVISNLLSRQSHFNLAILILLIVAVLFNIALVVMLALGSYCNNNPSQDSIEDL